MEINTVCESGMMPERKHPFDAGADLRADLDGARRTVLPRTVAFINTGVRCEIPDGYGLCVRPQLDDHGAMVE